MKSDLLINTALLSSLFLVLFAIGEVLYHILKISADNTRKLTHLSSALLCLFFPKFLQEPIYVFLLCASFAVLLTVSKKLNLLKSINNVKRKSYGSLAFPIAVFMIFSNWYYLGNNNFIFFISLIVMGVSDPLAAFVGEKWQIKNNKSTDTKSNIGSLSFFISAFVLVLYCDFYFQIHFGPSLIIYSFLYALSACIAERFTPLGLDNITIPLVLILLNSVFFG